jgi:hypothetical protein
LLTFAKIFQQKNNQSAMETPSIATAMSPDDYIKNRIDDQIDWYNRKSNSNKNWFYRCNVITILCSALIPFLVGFSSPEQAYLKYLAGAFGVIITITQGILSLKKYQENWMTYRSTAEMLQREKLLFLNGVGDFEDDAYAYKVFVMKAEQILSSENTNWITLQGTKEKPKEV